MVSPVCSAFPVSEHRTKIEKLLWPTRRPRPSFKPTQAIFLCFSNRCGSTFVASQMAGMGYAGAPSSEKNFEFFNFETVQNVARRAKIADFSAYLDYCVAHHTSALGLFLTKVSIDQLVWLTDIGVVGRVFEDPIFIHVRRRDVIAQAISISIALQTGEWTSLHPKSKVVPEFKPKLILELARQVTTANAWSDLYFEICVRKVSKYVYEDWVEDPKALRASLESAVGTPARAVTQEFSPERQGGARNSEWHMMFRSWAKENLEAASAEHHFM